MSQAIIPIGHEPASASKALFGFWVYLMTDCVLFASLFATYAVLRTSTFGGPGAGELFNPSFVLLETMVLLTSSFTSGLGMLAAHRVDKQKVLFWFGVTFGLGLLFLGLELYEFQKLVAEGNSWRRSGFLSAYFVLVGTHGLHIVAGLMWMFVMLERVAKQGLTSRVLKRLTLLSMFWHFLDIIWIFIFTLVYMVGAAL